jgi:hypothetical protein
LAIVFGSIAFLLVLFMTLICIRKKRRTHREGGPAGANHWRGLGSRALHLIPNPFRHETALPTCTDSAEEYPVGYTAIYRDEKRNQNVGPSDSLLSKNSSSSLNVSQQHSPPRTMGIVSANAIIDTGPRTGEGITLEEAAPPAYSIDLPASVRTSLGASFYV